MIKEIFDTCSNPSNLEKICEKNEFSKCHGVRFYSQDKEKKNHCEIFKSILDTNGEKRCNLIKASIDFILGFYSCPKK